MYSEMRIIIQRFAGPVGIALALGSAAVAADPMVAAPGEIVVRLAPSSTLAAAESMASTAGCRVLRPIAYMPGYYVFGINGVTLGGSPVSPGVATWQTISRLREAGAFAADPNYRVKILQTAPTGQKFTANDPLANRTWGLDMIRMPEAWNIQTAGRVIRVGVVDSGIVAGHPDFQLPSGGSKVTQQNFVAGDNNEDSNGHGTHVGGTIAASTNNGVGVPSVAGLNRGGVDVRLVSARVFDASGASGLDTILAGVGFIGNQNVQVANFSLGVGPGPLAQMPGSFADAIRGLMDKGIVVVAAAGNDGLNNTDDAVVYPGDVAGVIKVTSVGPDRRLASYSNFGGNPKKIAAPGGALNGNPLDDILSTVPLTLNATGYDAQAGTSMACPHVAGVAALLVGSGAKPADVYQAMASSAQVPAGGADRDKFGPGIVDAYSALLPYADPDPTVGFVGGSGIDRGITYFSRFAIRLQMLGISKIVQGVATPPQISESDIRVEVKPTGRNSAPAAVFVGGRNGSGDFDIPSLGVDDVKSRTFEVNVPRPGVNFNLGPGSYKVSVVVAGVEKSVQFVTVEGKVIPKGRSMFALPFRTNAITDVSAERGIFGLAPSFSLARFNPTRLAGQEDYLRFRSNGSATDSLARFDLAGSVVSFDTLDPLSSIAPVGIGYWLDLDRDVVIDTSRLPESTGGTGASVVQSPVGIKLYANGGGWNMIGAPYTEAVDWASCSIVVDGASMTLEDAVNAGVIMRAAVGFRNGDYVYGIAPAGKLEPFQGYWVRVYRDCTLVVPPASGVSRAVVRRGQNNLPDGLARIGVAIDGDRDASNFFGVAKGGDAGVDRLDIPKPPAGGGHAYLRFLADDANGRSQALAVDVRKLGSARNEWMFSVSSVRDGAEARLSWDRLAALGNGRVVLTDIAQGTKISMNRAAGYSFRTGEAGSSRTFKISYEAGASRGPLTIGQIRLSGRASGTYSVTLTANRDVALSGVVMSLAGKPIAVMAGGGRSTATSETTLRWDGKSAAGGHVPAGSYRLQLTATDDDGQTAVVQRVIQVVR